jgi:chromosome segregation ATPase
LNQAESKAKEPESLLLDIKKGKSNDRIQRSLSRATARIAFLEEDARKSKEISDASLSALRLENLELSEELGDAKVRIKHLERISETGETVKQLTKEIRVLKSKYRQAQDALKSNAKQFDFGCESGNQSADDKAMKMEKMLKESYATIERQGLETKTLRRRLKALEREVELLNTQAVAAGGSNEIHLLTQEKDRLKQNLAIQEQELTTILGDLKKCKLKNQKLRDQIFTLKEQLFDAEKTKERVVDQELRINSLQRDKEEMKVQLQSMRQQLKDHQTRKKALEKELTENTSFLLAVKEKLQAQNQ